MDILKNMVRVGTVFDIDRDALKARVRFPDLGKTSGWLYVVNNRSYIKSYDGPQMDDDSAHTLTVLPWMPSIGDTVVVLNLPIDNADGFILGGVGG